MGILHFVLLYSCTFYIFIVHDNFIEATINAVTEGITNHLKKTDNEAWQYDEQKLLDEILLNDVNNNLLTNTNKFNLEKFLAKKLRKVYFHHFVSSSVNPCYFFPYSNMHNTGHPPSLCSFQSVATYSKSYVKDAEAYLSNLKKNKEKEEPEVSEKYHTEVVPQWNYCPGFAPAAIVLHNLLIEPDVLTIGQLVTVSAYIDVYDNISGGLVTADILLNHFIKIRRREDLCNLVACPVLRGRYTQSGSFTIPTTALPGPVTAKITLFDENNYIKVCVVVKIRINRRRIKVDTYNEPYYKYVSNRKELEESVATIKENNESKEKIIYKKKNFVDCESLPLLKQKINVEGTEKSSSHISDSINNGKTNAEIVEWMLNLSNAFMKKKSKNVFDNKAAQESVKGTEASNKLINEDANKLLPNEKISTDIYGRKKIVINNGPISYYNNNQPKSEREVDLLKISSKFVLKTPKFTEIFA